MFDFNVEFARGGATFATELFEKLAAGGVKENIIFSPFSIQACIALAFAGSSGETAEEIAKALRFASSYPPEVAQTFQFVFEKYKNSELVKAANKVYVKDGYTLKPEYESAVKEQYHAESEAINFVETEAAAAAINDWVSEKTAGKITELISADSLDDNTRVLLLNALHFKGSWANKFDKAQTAEDDFWIGEEESVKVPYMNQKAKFGYGYFDELGCTALDMPYENSDLSLFTLLPQERTGLKDLVEKLKTVNLVDLASKLNVDEVQVKFPKFKVDYAVELTEKLKELGVNKMFTDDAEFDNMLESPANVSVSKVLHKASIEVNEGGSEAAAATGMIWQQQQQTVCLPRPCHHFIVDRPFLYVIWNKKNILFAGAYVNAA